MFRFSRQLAVVVLLGLTAFPVAGHEEQVILVGQRASGDLNVDTGFPQPVALPASIFPGIPGYATGEVALHSTILDDPVEDLFQLATTANFHFVLLAKDPGIEIWTGAGYMQTNASYQIGPAPFDSHPLWTIPSGTPGNVYRLTLLLRDANGIYADSAPFELSFTPMEIQPQLNLERLTPVQAKLSWPTNAGGWEVEAIDALTNQTWVAPGFTPVIVGTNYETVIPSTAAAQFFRLRKL